MPSHEFTMANKLINELIFPFYQLERDMFIHIRPKPETDAEHSWSLALVACALAPLLDKTLDTGKIAQFAVVHDLVEVYAGDVSVWSEGDTYELKGTDERAALEKLRKEFSGLPWIAATIEEYERKDTNEALYVWSIDKYLAHYIRYLDEGQFFHQAGITSAKFDELQKRIYKKSHAHSAVGKIFDEIVAAQRAHPEWFAEE